MDKKYTKCILTNMVFIKNKDKFLIIDRKKKDWPGISFVGGHIKYDESFSQSAMREVKEETGLELLNLNLVDVYV